MACNIIPVLGQRMPSFLRKTGVKNFPANALGMRLIRRENL